MKRCYCKQDSIDGLIKRGSYKQDSIVTWKKSSSTPCPLGSSGDTPTSIRASESGVERSSDSDLMPRATACTTDDARMVGEAALRSSELIAPCPELLRGRRELGSVSLCGGLPNRRGEGAASGDKPRDEASVEAPVLSGSDLDLASTLSLTFSLSCSCC